MEYSSAEIAAALGAAQASSRYVIATPGNVEHAVARLLADNRIVARFGGRMEFGARALGNRSILANPADAGNVARINQAIKDRDFWMPFAPSILEEDMARYAKNSQRLFAPYMCISFDATGEARRDLAAAIHPRDFTLRPQAVRKAWNPGYHDLISAFKRITGIGAVLNTSFNLHGEPIVCSPFDAIRTADLSGIGHLALGDLILTKRSAQIHEVHDRSRSLARA
jgi:carbamoyltransferase